VSTEHLDEATREQLAADGLRLDLVDPADPRAYAGWSRAVTRGFLHRPEPDAQIEQRRTYGQVPRLVGVFDDGTPDAATPVATIDGWVAELTVPGGIVPAWAISAVTVSPTHRRRGLGRALVESELRTAADRGLAMAMLTVSESTIYDRFGFAPAALARDLVIDTRRARWAGPLPAGRLLVVSGEQLRVDGHELVERVRPRTPGQVQHDGILWDRQLGLVLGDPHANDLRFVRYDDAAGRPQGFAVYRYTEDEQDYANHTVTVQQLIAATPDAYAALWRFLLELDLVTTVRAPLRPVDEPLRRMITDFRAVRTSEEDHLWTRVLDVPGALGARTYGAANRLVLDVSDPQGHAAGTWALDVDADGTGAVTRVDEPADVALTVNALSALHLGGVPATMLATAGALTGDPARLDAIFRSRVEPYLGHWF
jgi:predicted acetyltransferase